MTRTIPGLHHVTKISGPPQSNVDFFTGTLRQRLVKKTVNFDAPGADHMYYGDARGAPGTILAFFPFADAGPGRGGPGMASAYAYAVPRGRFDGWMERLAEDAIDFAGPVERFGARGPDTAVAALVARGLSRDRIALARFSQGGCLALEYAARRGGFASVFGLPAGLVGTGDAEGGASDALHGHGPKAFDYRVRLDGVPLEITVHERDPHIPLARAREREAVFAGLGAEARLTVTTGARHGIGPEAVAAMRAHPNA